MLCFRSMGFYEACLSSNTDYNYEHMSCYDMEA